MVGSVVRKTPDGASYNELLDTYGKASLEKKDKDSHFIPIKLKPKEAKKILQCQRTMLEFVRIQYRKAIGTEKEEFMRCMYNDAIADYNLFIKQYENELK